MVFVLEMIINQDILWGDGSLVSGIQQMGRNALALQHDSGGINTKSGGAIRLAKNMLVPYHWSVGTILSGEIQIYIVIRLVTTQAHYYSRNILNADIQLGQTLLQGLLQLLLAGLV